MATRQAKPFKVKVHETLRYIMRLTEEGYEAWCIDAGAVGVGDTQQEAFQDLIVNLEALYKYASEEGLKWLATASDEEERLYARLAARQPVDPAVLGFGVVQRVEIVPTAAGKKLKLPSPAGFEISQHTSLAA